MATGDSPEVLERFHSALDLVDAAVRQIRRAVGRAVDQDDLVSYGREGLLEAARRYEPERGVPFRSYASYRVRGAVIDGARATGRVPRRAFARLHALETVGWVGEGTVEDSMTGPSPGLKPTDAERALADHLAGMATAMAMGMVAARPGPAGSAPPDPDPKEAADPETLVARAELVAIVEREMRALSREEATLLRRHYLEGESFDSVARDLGLSRSWACRLHARAISRLGRRLRRAAV